MAYSAQAQLACGSPVLNAGTGKVKTENGPPHCSFILVFDSVQSQAYAWTQDAARPPLLFAIFRKFCNACSRVSMSAISVVASSNTFGGGALCCCDRCDSAVAAAELPDPGPKAGWWMGGKLEGWLSALLREVMYELSRFLTSCRARPGEVECSADSGLLFGRPPGSGNLDQASIPLPQAGRLAPVPPELGEPARDLGSTRGSA
eukprot:CAMPEP_0202375400 /NCGR_PEP_ID=MMETSP1127-20130417/6081_1 /ASSEMBLY_ACC=CAM_ASM_000462 /TAXON_ID=3047 /ORGANISM="Dunaliella tertiolecta, Strain CCMP1320" /LENGTH=203 /DNA_ID=CAMNT_0048972861 /DNA_START=92 /DNA_END=704 /DNA_ORIENTATION=+